MALDLFALALRLQSVGLAEAKRALAEIEAQGQRTALSLTRLEGRASGVGGAFRTPAFAQASSTLADVEAQGRRTAQSLGGLSTGYKQVTDSSRAMALKQMEAIRINAQFDAANLVTKASLTGVGTAGKQTAQSLGGLSTGYKQVTDSSRAMVLKQVEAIRMNAQFGASTQAAKVALTGVGTAGLQTAQSLGGLKESYVKVSSAGQATTQTLTHLNTGLRQSSSNLAGIRTGVSQATQGLVTLSGGYKRVTDSTRQMTLRQIEAIGMNAKFDASARLAANSTRTLGQRLLESIGITKKFETGTLGATTGLNKMSGGIAGLGASFRLLGGFIAAAAIGTLLKRAISEAGEAEAAMASLQQAIKNAGGDFAVLGPAAETAAKGIQSLTRFSDDEAIGALATLTTITSDASKALRNIGLAADIAAAKHMSLEQGAEVVGRVLTGNFRILKQYGINVKETGDVMQTLRDKFGGFAEKEGATFQGRMAQLRNAFQDVLESLGRVVTNSDTTTEALGKVTQLFARLSKWIDDNAVAWRAWLKTAYEFTTTWYAGFKERAQNVANWFNVIAEAINTAGLAFRNFLLRGSDPQAWKALLDQQKKLEAAWAKATGPSFSDVEGAATTRVAGQLPPVVIKAKVPRDVVRGGAGEGGTKDRVSEEARAAALLREIRDNASDMLLRAAHRDDEADFARIEREFSRRKEEIAKLKVSEKTKTDLLLAATKERGAAVQKLETEIWERTEAERVERLRDELNFEETRADAIKGLNVEVAEERRQLATLTEGSKEWLALSAKIATNTDAITAAEDRRIESLRAVIEWQRKAGKPVVEPVRAPGAQAVIEPEPINIAAVALKELNDLLAAHREELTRLKPGTDEFRDKLEQIAHIEEIITARPIGVIPDAQQWIKGSLDALDQYRESVIERVANMGAEIQQAIAHTLGDAVLNGFTAAFSGAKGIGGALKAFGKTVLAGLGQLMVQEGQVLFEYGLILTGLLPFLTNIFTSGPALLAAGAALIALGSAFSAVAARGGGGGGASHSAPRESQFGRGTETITRLRFVDSRTGNFLDNFEPKRPINFTVIGQRDAKAQRQITQMIEKYDRRTA
jgi:hypothetical protein